MTTWHPSIRLTGPSGGVWQESRADRVQCACCGTWTSGTVWRYWLKLVAIHTVCNHCATGSES